jgi:hypothetical protein
MEKSSFFNSVGGDRRYKAQEFAEYFNSFIANGIFPVPSNGLQVLANNSMDVTVKAGKAWINGYYYCNTGDLAVTLGTADGVLNRIDRLVLRWSLSTRDITVQVLQGAYSASPAAPALSRNADVYELALADVYVGKGVVSIKQANITDQRLNAALCGIVIGAVQQIDPSVLTAQFDNFFELYRQLITQRYGDYNVDIAGLEGNATADYNNFLAALSALEDQYKQNFDEWFQTVQDILDGDVAGNLTALIQDLQGRVTELESVIAAIPTFAAAAWLGNCYSGAAYLSTN